MLHTAHHVYGDRVDEEDSIVFRHTKHVDHGAVGDVEASNLHRVMKITVRITVQMECFTHSRGSFYMEVEDVIGAWLLTPVSTALNGVQSGIIHLDMVECRDVEDINNGKVSAGDELVPHPGGGDDGVVGYIAAYFIEVSEGPVIWNHRPKCNVGNYLVSLITFLICWGLQEFTCHLHPGAANIELVNLGPSIRYIGILLLPTKVRLCWPILDIGTLNMNIDQ